MTSRCCELSFSFRFEHKGCSSKILKKVHNKIEEAQRLLRAFFFKSIVNLYRICTEDTISLLFMKCMLLSLCGSCLGNSEASHRSVLYPQRSFSNSLHSRTILQRRSLKTTIVIAYNWLRTIDLIPSNLKTFSESLVKTVIINIANLYISNDSEIFSVYLLPS